MCKRVAPKYFEGWSMSIMQVFGKGPKFKITCGECSTSFTHRITMVSNPGCPCPHCGTVNVLPLRVD